MECPLPQIAQLVFRRPHSIVPKYPLVFLGPQRWKAALPIDLVCRWQLRSGWGWLPDRPDAGAQPRTGTPDTFGQADSRRLLRAGTR